MISVNLKKITQNFLKQKRSSLQIFSSLEALLILKFWEIIKNNNDYKLLDVNYSKDKVYTSDELDLLSDTWNQLYDEYFKRKNNKEAKYFLKLSNDALIIIQEISLLEDFKERFILLYELQKEAELNDFVIEKKVLLCNEIKETFPKLKFNQFDEVYELVEFVDSVIKAKTNIYNEKFNVLGKKVDKKVQNIYRDVVNIGRELGIQLNVNTMSVAEFLEYENTAIESSIAKEKNNGK